MDKATKEKLLKNIEIAEQKLNEQYWPYRDKVNKELASIWYEIMWSEKMPPHERKLSDKKLKKMRNLFIKVLEEEKQFREEERGKRAG